MERPDVLASPPMPPTPVRAHRKSLLLCAIVLANEYCQQIQPKPKLGLLLLLPRTCPWVLAAAVYARDWRRKNHLAPT
jgi:hypothetical protein